MIAKETAHNARAKMGNYYNNQNENMLPNVNRGVVASGRTLI